jgi:hypothetical protein
MAGRKWTGFTWPRKTQGVETCCVSERLTASHRKFCFTEWAVSSDFAPSRGVVFDLLPSNAATLCPSLDVPSGKKWNEPTKEVRLAFSVCCIVCAECTHDGEVVYVSHSLCLICRGAERIVYWRSASRVARRI